MPHLVTSHQGKPHVLAVNDARRNAAMYGGGKYVLPIRGRFAASVPNANTIRIQSGDAMVCGRHWAIDGAYEDYTIENGTPGYSRIDLVVARIETAPEEKVEILVRKGQESSGEPVAPSHIDGDLLAGDSAAELPLYHVRVDGLTPQEPKPLFETAPDPYVGHNHSADDITSGTLPKERGGTGRAALVGLPSLLCDLFDTNLPDASYVPVFTSEWADGGYMTLQNLRNKMGLGNTTGALPVERGGSGLTASPSMLVNLGSTTAANVMQASPRPGITGTLAIAHGGTGATTAANARSNLGIKPGYIVAGHNANQTLANSMNRVTLGTTVDVSGSNMFQLTSNTVKVLQSGIYLVYGQAAVMDCGADASVQLNIVGSKVCATSVHVWGFDTISAASVMKINANQTVYMEIGNWSGNVGSSPANPELSYLVVAKIGEV